MLRRLVCAGCWLESGEERTKWEERRSTVGVLPQQRAEQLQGAAYVPNPKPPNDVSVDRGAARSNACEVSACLPHLFLSLFPYFPPSFLLLPACLSLCLLSRQSSKNFSSSLHLSPSLPLSSFIRLPPLRLSLSPPPSPRSLRPLPFMGCGQSS